MAQHNTLDGVTVIAFDFFGVISSEVALPWFEQHFPPTQALELKRKYIYPADIGEVSITETYGKLATLAGTSPESVASEWNNLVSIDQTIIDFIKGVKPHHKIILCSNAPASFLRPILQKYQLEQYFDTILISSEIGVTKPDQRFFEIALEQIGVPPQECLLIDDSLENVTAAAQLGIRTVHFEKSKYSQLVSASTLPQAPKKLLSLFAIICALVLIVLIILDFADSNCRGGECILSFFSFTPIFFIALPVFVMSIIAIVVANFFARKKDSSNKPDSHTDSPL